MITRIYPTLRRGYITKSTLALLSSGGLLFVGYELVTLNEHFYENAAMPLLHKFVEPEQAHKLAVNLARHGWLVSSKGMRREFDELECTVFGKTFTNPIGLAAGFDKNAEAIESLGKSGFGFLEVGSVTPLPQPGNPQPRLFRIPQWKAVINRYGFNSDGMGVVSERVRDAYEKCAVPLGVNLGKNKASLHAETDYELGATYFACCCDYLVVNVSSPNTPGLRGLQANRRDLARILAAVNRAMERVVKNGGPKFKPPLLLKVSPDLSDDEKSGIASLCLDKRNGIDGLIVSNTTTSRPTGITHEKHGDETGGLSGGPLKELSTACISDMYRLTRGRVPIIGCGGVATGEDAYRKIRAGASLVQLYTALVYQGFPVVGRVKRELAECLRRDNLARVQDAIGLDSHVGAPGNQCRSWWHLLVECIEYRLSAR